MQHVPGQLRNYQRSGQQHQHIQKPVCQDIRVGNGTTCRMRGTIPNTAVPAVETDSCWRTLRRCGDRYQFVAFPFTIRTRRLETRPVADQSTDVQPAFWFDTSTRRKSKRCCRAFSWGVWKSSNPHRVVLSEMEKVLFWKEFNIFRLTDANSFTNLKGRVNQSKKVSKFHIRPVHSICPRWRHGPSLFVFTSTYQHMA